MSRGANRYLRNDLRKQTTIEDIFFFNDINFQSCMVMLFVMGVLLFTVLSIATTPNPSIVFGL